MVNMLPLLNLAGSSQGSGDTLITQGLISPPSKSSSFHPSQVTTGFLPLNLWSENSLGRGEGDREDQARRLLPLSLLPEGKHVSPPEAGSGLLHTNAPGECGFAFALCGGVLCLRSVYHSATRTITSFHQVGKDLMLIKYFYLLLCA